jgi:2-polyprenyl-3-methyl-5-hydroxy-6-metoxy-1,4-benzoquinol methylase
MTVDIDRLANLRYEDFKALASEEGLSPHERIGFTDACREGQEEAILTDIRSKASSLDVAGSTIVDIGCGCGVLARALIDRCLEMKQRLVAIDSAEVLAQLPDLPHLHKVAGRFPQETAAALADLSGRADAIIVYSVLHYVILDANPFDFLDRALALLAPGGQLLVGDVPNTSMRRRFFSSAAGKAFHRSFMATTSDPDVVFNALEPGKIDDSVVLGLVMRARSAGFDGFVLPQRSDLPMANRREDLLFRRP